MHGLPSCLTQTLSWLDFPLSVRWTLSFLDVSHNALTDILNRLNPSFKVKQKPSPHELSELDPRQLAEKARHLSKYIFPRQYSLTNVFAMDSDTFASANNTPDIIDREDEIEASRSHACIYHLAKGYNSCCQQKRKGCKTPKRVKPALTFLEKMISRHAKCKYRALRDLACPSKVCFTVDDSLSWVSINTFCS